ncbi:MAG: DegT/DnrJ/EryC1/StrS family aminotransferase [Deltaproteobacteria bacterium]|nr:DegT/DnrJ/EryC1/StrS family aminotransferase [Deltaproteobacteria bacterium]
MSASAAPAPPPAPGPPIPYARHHVDDGDRAAVLRALASPAIAQGPEAEALGAELARTIGTRHGVAVTSGTAALTAALGALGVGPGDEVIVPPLTFVATANAVLACGARPRFADVEPDTLNLDPAAVARAVTSRTRGAIPVHYAGHPADVAAIAEALGPGRFVLEDACHALGAAVGERAAGALGHAACFSFHPAKAITTGEGGAVVTDDAELAGAVRRLRDHGLERAHSGRRGLGLPPEWDAEQRGDWVYELHALGTNHRLAEPAAALGRSQLARLASRVARRRALAERYTSALAGEDALVLPSERPGVRSAWHLYPVRVQPGTLRGGRAALFAALRMRGIGVQVHYVPVHLQPLYRERLGTRFGDHPVAEQAYLGLLSLPLHPWLGDADWDRVLDELRGELRRARR